MDKQEQEEEKKIIPAPFLLITEATVDKDADGQAFRVFLSLFHNS